jgi:tetratricopeptide (TPR) repeat protein
VEGGRWAAAGRRPTGADLAELRFNAGDLDAAAGFVDDGLRRLPEYPPLLAERAKIEAARGEVGAALADYRTMVTRLPQPGYAAEYGDLLASTGDRAGAERQYELVRATDRLFAALGVDTDVDLAVFEADHGAPERALAAARAGYAKRPSIAVADALAWALHMVGRDSEALRYADEALRLGTRSAMLHYHRGTILAALGRSSAARADLAQALHLNPYFSVRFAPAARAALATLGGA